MHPRLQRFGGEVEPVNYSLGQVCEPFSERRAMALLTLSHTPIEQTVYLAMREQTFSLHPCNVALTIRRLMLLTGINGYSSIRRGLCGLVRKRSIERERPNAGERKRNSYTIYGPVEIFHRRRLAGMAPYPEAAEGYARSVAPGLALERVITFYDLSRREAQVALCCAEGRSNAEIGKRLGVSEQTIKFHLRRIFLKFGVKRRTELVSRLLTQQADGAGGE